MTDFEPKVFTSVDELRAAIGTDLGSGEWLEITQERVNAFAEATGDHQWIHVDVEKAKSGPFGATIAHGYLTLSLLPVIAGGIFTVEGALPAIVSVNEKINEPRFPSFKGIMAAKKKEIAVVSLADIGVDAGEVGLASAATSVTAVTPKPAKQAGEQRTPGHAADRSGKELRQRRDRRRLDETARDSTADDAGDRLNDDGDQCFHDFLPRSAPLVGTAPLSRVDCSMFDRQTQMKAWV